MHIGKCSVCGRTRMVDDDQFCDPCRKVLRSEVTLVDRLYRLGHSHECSGRMIWSDGKCQCGYADKHPASPLPDNFPPLRVVK